MAHINHYEVLQIEQTSDSASIRNAFKKLAMKYHPDRNIGDASAEIMMKKLNEAMEVLSDPGSRKDHDQSLAEEYAKKLEEENANRLAEEYAKKFAEENANRLAEENAKRFNKNAALKAYNNGTASALTKDFQASINHFTKAIELDPSFADAYISRGNTYDELKAYHEAVSDYTSTIKFDPKNLGAFNSRGIAYYRLKRYPEAIADYTTAIEINPSEADIYYNRGLSYGALGRHYFALDDYIQAIRLNPLHAKAHIYLKKVRQQIKGRDNPEEGKKQKKTPYIKNYNNKIGPLFIGGGVLLLIFALMWIKFTKNNQATEIELIEKEMILIPSGKFMMGDQLVVTLTEPYYIGKYEVTQEQWKGVMGNNPCETKSPKLPITEVSWYHCQHFIKKLNAKTNGGYRLPTEAEWEYACRAGTTTSYSYGNTIMPKDANYNDSKIYKPVSVGSYRPNAFGLYDMHGNVWEWCEDRYYGLPTGSTTDPKGPETGDYRLLRGGSFVVVGPLNRSSFRNYSLPTAETYSFGFRLAKTP